MTSHHVEVCTLSCRDIDPYPPHHRMAFAFSTVPSPHPRRPTLRLPALFREGFGLTTFPIDNLSDDLGSACPPAVLSSVCTEDKAVHPACSPFWSKRISIFRLLIITTFISDLHMLAISSTTWFPNRLYAGSTVPASRPSLQGYVVTAA